MIGRRVRKKRLLTERTYLGESLRRRRLLFGLSQAALAKRAGTSQRTISEVEAGRRDVTFSVLDRITRALDLAVTLIRDRPVPAKKAAQAMEGGKR